MAHGRPEREAKNPSSTPDAMEILPGCFFSISLTLTSWPLTPAPLTSWPLTPTSLGLGFLIYEIAIR